MINDDRFIDDVLALDHLAIPQSGLVAGPDRRVSFWMLSIQTSCSAEGFEEGWL